MTIVNFKIATPLTIIFVIAKLWGIINWSWWLVFLPSIIQIAIILLMIILQIIAELI